MSRMRGIEHGNLFHSLTVWLDLSMRRCCETDSGDSISLFFHSLLPAITIGRGEACGMRKLLAMAVSRYVSSFLSKCSFPRQ